MSTDSPVKLSFCKRSGGLMLLRCINLGTIEILSIEMAGDGRNKHVKSGSSPEVTSLPEREDSLDPAVPLVNSGHGGLLRCIVPAKSRSSRAGYLAKTLSFKIPRTRSVAQSHQLLSARRHFLSFFRNTDRLLKTPIYVSHWKALFEQLFNGGFQFL